MSGRTYVICGVLVMLAVIGAGLLRLRSLPQEAQVLSAAQPVEQAEPYTISLVGDILLGARVGDVAARQGAATLFARVAPIFRADDLTIGNFESAASTRGVAAQKQFTFRAHPDHLPALRAGGVDAVSLANNHSLDYGREALLDTLAHLRKAGVTPVGAGTDLDSAFAPAYFTRQGQTVALLAASRVWPSADWQAGPRRPGLAGAYDATRLCREIRAARERADFVLVYLHWGVERAVKPEPYQRTMARALIDAGADAVIGSHPHVLQGFEFYRGKFIAYSLGNFIFTNHGNATIILQLEISGDTLTAARAIPCRILRYVPTPVSEPKDRRAILRDLAQRSYDVRVTDEGMIVAR